ncbi:hypothetical protein FA15DRAFT_663634 [Coprinopsis marcescibilis]|uniref:Transmembrane protein n=1 Tax=Coprinopsis marcescibilis TaxID=230819 RepID=A0A5C3LBT2_COPMA|nr:hypothetical protein FA15DRAFT_663634 [Coprinopsis marcescibilis]
MSGEELPLRLVLFDDTHRDIVYTGPWFERVDSFPKDSGLVYKGSQHGTFGNASLSFRFNGTAVFLLGRSESNIVDNELRAPGWNCSIDGIISPLTSEHVVIGPAQLNNFLLCGRGELEPGPHNFTVHTNATEQLPFWADRINIRPTRDASYANTNVFYPPLDVDILYHSGSWFGPDNGRLKWTTDADATVLLDFTGTRLTWVTTPIEGQASGKSRAVYVVDDQEPVFIEITGIAPGEKNLDNRILFETPELPLGRHRINVTHLGPAAPLVMNFLEVENGDTVPFGGTSPESPFGGGSENPSGLAGSKTNVGAIAGGVVGGVVGLVLLVLGWLWYRKRQRRSEEDLKSGILVTPFVSSGPVPPAATGGTMHTKSSPSQRSPFSDSVAEVSRTTPLGIAAKGAPPPSSTSGQTSTSPQSSDGLSPTSRENDEASNSDGRRVEVVHHTDSGVRLGNASPVEVVELPPTYTPS